MIVRVYGGIGRVNLLELYLRGIIRGRVIVNQRLPRQSAPARPPITDTNAHAKLQL